MLRANPFINAVSLRNECWSYWSGSAQVTVRRYNRANPSLYGNATSSVVNLNGTWNTHSISFVADSAWRYTVHFRNSNSGNTSMQIDSIQVYGEKTATYLSCTGDSVGYRFGFNGQEKDNEVTGIEGSHNTAEYWMYDTRLGRRWNVDPMVKKYPFISPYSSFQNSPIIMVDSNGDSTLYYLNGELIHVSHDDLENAVIFITTDDRLYERQVREVVTAHSNLPTGDNHSINSSVREILIKQGHDVFMIDDYKGFYKISYNDRLKINPKYSIEAGYYNYKKNGVIRPGPYTKDGNEVDVTTNHGVINPSLGEVVSKGHTHENTGLPRSGKGDTFTETPGKEDMKTKDPSYNTVVTENYIYFNGYDINHNYKTMNVAIPKKNTFGASGNGSRIENVKNEVKDAFKDAGK